MEIEEIEKAIENASLRAEALARCVAHFPAPLQTEKLIEAYKMARQEYYWFTKYARSGAMLETEANTIAELLRYLKTAQKTHHFIARK